MVRPFILMTLISRESFMLSAQCRTVSQLLTITAISLALGACGGRGIGSKGDGSDIDGGGYSSFQSASLVIGQSGLTSTSEASPSSRSLAGAWGAASLSGDQLFIAATEENRVVVYSGVPTDDYAAASFAIGQANLVEINPGTTAGSLDGPTAVQALGGALYITDRDNSRVLIYNTIPDDSPGAADVAVGAVSLTSIDSGCDDSSLNNPMVAVATDDGKLVVADTDNHRVLIWNSIPDTSGEPADLVLGQADMDSCFANGGTQDSPEEDGVTARDTLRLPSGLWTDGEKLVVADAGNSRVLIWESFPTADRENPDVVLGQIDFTGNIANDEDGDGDQGNPAATTLNLENAAVHFDDTRLCVADDLNHRVLIWDTFPSNDAEPADRVIGQQDFSQGQFWDDNQNNLAESSPTARTLREPRGCVLIGNQLLVADFGSDRMLVFDEGDE